MLLEFQIYLGILFGNSRIPRKGGLKGLAPFLLVPFLLPDTKLASWVYPAGKRAKKEF